MILDGDDKEFDVNNINESFEEVDLSSTTASTSEETAESTVTVQPVQFASFEDL